jgi:hypothetical protein
MTTTTPSSDARQLDGADARELRRWEEVIESNAAFDEVGTGLRRIRDGGRIAALMTRSNGIALIDGI